MGFSRDIINPTYKFCISSWYEWCYGLNVCIPSKFIFETLIPKVMVVEGRALGR